MPIEHRLAFHDVAVLSAPFQAHNLVVLRMRTINVAAIGLQHSADMFTLYPLDEQALNCSE
jgi:hypothetical protein